MTAYWVTFEDRKPGCIEVDAGKGSEHALLVAAEVTEHVPLQATPLPYPAEPRLNVIEYEWN